MVMPLDACKSLVDQVGGKWVFEKSAYQSPVRSLIVVESVELITTAAISSSELLIHREIELAMYVRIIISNK